MSRLKLAVISIIITQFFAILLLSGIFLQYKQKITQFELQELAKKTDQVENARLNNSSDTWTEYIDDKRNFQIKLPVNTIKKSYLDYSFEGMKPYSAEVISSSGNFPDISVEISEAGTKPFIPTNYESEEETTQIIGGRLNIKATKYFGYIHPYSSNTHKTSYVITYLLFERNNENYLVKYSKTGYERNKNPDKYDQIFIQIVDSITFSGIYIVPESDLQIIGSERYYKDIQMKFTVPVSKGWTVTNQGEENDPAIIITNEPVSKFLSRVVSHDSRNSEYSAIYFSRGEPILSTSGQSCTISCEENGDFTTTIDGREYTTHIMLVNNERNRFNIELNNGNLYIGASYPKNGSTADLQHVISSVQFE